MFSSRHYGNGNAMLICHEPGVTLMATIIPSAFSGSGAVSPSGVCEHEFGYKCHGHPRKRHCPQRPFRGPRKREPASAAEARAIKMCLNCLLARKHCQQKLLVYASTRPRLFTLNVRPVP